MTNAHITIDSSRTVAPVSRRLFGSFVEHVGRCVYGGIYEPDHPSADSRGFRSDVKELVRELGTTTIRYPGGNFVSGYRWEDGVGPRANRPTRLDLAWHSLETNQIGVDEFATWCAETGHELMMAVNLGSRGLSEALNLLEYCNHPGGTQWSDYRVANGSPQPHGIKMWCLGNEMDGPWQIGHRSAEDYASTAARVAAAMKMFDPSLELVACGSSSSQMATFGEWERVVLEKCHDYIDFISCHAYYQEKNGDLGSFLASAVDMAGFIETVAGVADQVAAQRGSNKQINISFDEWNVWYMDEHDEQSTAAGAWPKAPHLLEDVYSAADAVVAGSLLVTLLNHADRVKAASLAQLVNAIAPIMAEPGGPAWRQTIFYPFSATSRLARGVALRPAVDCGNYNCRQFGEVPLVDAAATVNQESGQAALFLVNRSLEATTDVTVDLKGLEMNRLASVSAIHEADPHVRNTATMPERVLPKKNQSAHLSADGRRLAITLPPVSWTAVTLAR
jgi:alpha-N-arabinofuranosidase